MGRDRRRLPRRLWERDERLGRRRAVPIDQGRPPARDRPLEGSDATGLNAGRAPKFGPLGPPTWAFRISTATVFAPGCRGTEVPLELALESIECQRAQGGRRK